MRRINGGDNKEKETQCLNVGLQVMEHAPWPFYKRNRHHNVGDKYQEPSGHRVELRSLRRRAALRGRRDREASKDGEQKIQM